MRKRRVWTLLIVLACVGFTLSGCDEVSSLDVKQGDHDSNFMSWRDRYLQLGQDTYMDACSICHDEGENGAPVTGDREDWSDRSMLWSAVLTTHAKKGYLGMPAKGGCDQLSEHEITAATEYMLSTTFPEMPRD